MAKLNVVLQQLRAEHHRAQLEVARLDQAIAAVESVSGRTTSVAARGGKRTLSPAARRRIARAQKARWAKVRVQKSAGKTSSKRGRKLSPAARRRIAAAQKARWAKFRANQKKKK